MKASMVSMMIVAAFGAVSVAYAGGGTCGEKAAKKSCCPKAQAVAAQATCDKDASKADCGKAKLASNEDGKCGVKAKAVANEDCCAKAKAVTVSGCCPKGKAVAAKDGCDPAKCEKSCDPAKCEMAKNCDKSKCSTAKMVACGMPAMKYRVGDACTGCPKEAMKLAQEHEDTPIRFVVCDREFDTKSDAMAAYIMALEDYHTKLTRVHYTVGEKSFACPKAAGNFAKTAGSEMHYTVGSHEYNCADKAAAVAKAAAEASNGVEYTLVVDGKKYDGRKVCFRSASNEAAGKTCDMNAKTCDKSAKTCDKSAKAVVAKKASTCCPKSGEQNAETTRDGRQWVSGESCEYIVDGTHTGCDKTARVKELQARIAAAYQAIEQMNGQEVAGR